MRHTTKSAAWLAALLSLVACAGGNSKPAMVRDCEQVHDWNLKVSGCTAMINSGTYSGHNLVVAYNNRGNTHISLGNHPQAIEDFDQALGIDPNNAIPYNGRGNAYAELGQSTRAIADYDRAINLAPNYDLAYSNRGMEHDALGDYQKANDDFDRAIRLAPTEIKYYSNRGFTRCHQGHVEGAIEDYMHGIHRDTNAAKAAQSQLHDFGYFNGVVDGDFDPASQKALREWIEVGCPTFTG